MTESDQQMNADTSQRQLAVAEVEGTCKPKTREVKARYMQSKHAPASRRQGGECSIGRPSLAVYHSAGWVELQLPNHASTPLMMNTAGSSAVFTQNSKHRRPQQTPAPSTAQRPIQQTALSQRRQQQQRQHHKAELRTTVQQQQHPQQQQQHTATAIAGHQRLQHDVAPLSDTARHASGGGAPSSTLISPGSSCSSTSCSFRQSHEVPGLDVLALQPCRHAAAAEAQTPQVSRLATSMVVGPGSAMRPARLGMSADVGSALHTERTTDKAAAERKSKLEEFLLQKRLQKQLGPNTAAGAKKGSQGNFREPAPKTIFKATADAVVHGASRPPASARPPVGTSTAAAAAAAAPAIAAVSCTSDSFATPAAVVGAIVPAGSPGSAFKATMATLQQTGSGSKAGRPSPLGKAHSSKARRPSCVPVLPLDRVQPQESAITHMPEKASAQQQQLRRLSMPAATTKIPALDFSAVTLQQQQQQGGLSIPLSSRHVSNAAHVPLPDATPRTFRDAPPSRLPKTPRGPVPTYTSAVAKPSPAASGLQLNGRSGAASSPAVPSGTGSMSSRQKPAAGAYTGSKTPRATGSKCAAKSASATPSHVAAIVGRQGPSSNAGGVTATDTLPAAAVQRTLKTPRGPALPAAAVACSAPCTARSLESSAAGHGVGAPAVASSANERRTDNERADEVRQQLRLLRMQHLQLRHMTARVEAAVQVKKEKAESAAAAAAAAVIERSGELLAMKGHLVHEQWSSQLAKLLQRQLPKLRMWAQVHARHTCNVAKLQGACKVALSHVPLLHGAAVGYHPEAPDQELLQRQLVHGMQLLQEVSPALQQLLGPDLAATTSSGSGLSSSQGLTEIADSRQTASACGAAQQANSSSSLPKQQLGVLSNSIKTTAALAEQLMDVAAEECSILSQLSQQLVQLADLHLYANSMQVQLEQMKEAAEV